MKRPDRLLPDKLASTFLTNRDGNIVSLSAPLEPILSSYVLQLATAPLQLFANVRRQFQERRDDTSCDARLTHGPVGSPRCRYFISTTGVKI